jgi:Ser/Thr protein kinase RdoA (MazF antagonist)
LRRYDVSPSASVTLLNESENITFRVDDPLRQTSMIFRFYRYGYHAPAAIMSELAWMEDLRVSAGILTPGLIPARDGSVLQLIQDDLRVTQRHAVMFEHLTGAEPSGQELLGSFKRLGRIAARMHNHAQTWTPPTGFQRLTWDFDTMIASDRPVWGRWQDGIGLGADDRTLLARALDVIARRLDGFGKGPDRFGLIHADLRVTNLLIEGEATKIIDFDDCGLGWYLYDLSAALTFIEDHPESDNLVSSWLDGYRESRFVSTDEIGEIPTFNLLRRILIVAWIASHIESETATRNGEAYTGRACEAARRYLARFA